MGIILLQPEMQTDTKQLRVDAMPVAGFASLLPSIAVTVWGKLEQVERLDQHQALQALPSTSHCATHAPSTDALRTAR